MIPHFPRTKRMADGSVSQGGWRRSFRAVLDYLFDEQEHAGEDVRLAHGNMAGRTPKDLAREFGLSRALRPDIERPVWHVALSPAPEDRDAWSNEEQRHAIVEAFVERTITKEWEARREQALARGHTPPAQPALDAYQWCGVEHRKPGAHDRPEHVHIVLSRIGLDERLWYANRDAYHAAEACRELETEYQLRQLVRGGSHAAWKHPDQVLAVDGTDKALLDRGERAMKAEAAARTRVAIAALGEREFVPHSEGPLMRQAESVLQRELGERGVRLERMINSRGDTNGYRLTLVDGDGKAVRLEDGREASWSGSRLGFKKGRTIESTLEHWIAQRGKARDLPDRDAL